MLKENRDANKTLDDLKAAAESSGSAHALAEQELRQHTTRLQEELRSAKEEAAKAEEDRVAAMEMAKLAKRRADMERLCHENEKAVVAELTETRSSLVLELEEVRTHADHLAKSAAALTMPKYRNTDDENISYRTVCRAHQEDREYLQHILTKRSWRASDVAAALNTAGLLRGVFDSTEVHACIPAAPPRLY